MSVLQLLRGTKRSREDTPVVSLGADGATIGDCPSFSRAIHKLRNLFFSSSSPHKISGKEVSTACVKTAEDQRELDVYTSILQGFGTSERVQQKVRATIREATVNNTKPPPDALSKLPKTLKQDVEKRALEIECKPTNVSNPALLQQLGEVFQVQTEEIQRMRTTKHGLFSLVDIAMLVSNVSAEHAAIQIRRVQKQYPDVFTQCKDFKFPGAGQRVTPTGDIYVCIELVMLLPGRRAGMVRSKAARLLVEYYGGNLDTASRIIENREKQDIMSIEAPNHPMRAMGEAVERESGSTDEQLSDLRRKMADGVQAVRNSKDSYDASKFTSEHQNHKDMMNARFIDCIRMLHKNPDTLPGFVAILDDFDAHGSLRSTDALIRDLGIPAEKIISPNRNQTVVDALKQRRVLSELGDFSRIMFSKFPNHQIAAAYLDLTTGDPVSLEMAISRIDGSAMFNSVILATTMVERNFTQGGTEPFTKRVLRLTEYIHSLGYSPAYNNISTSYFEIRSGGQRVATQFWSKERPMYPEGRPGGNRIY